jgi:hypothetical protein
LTYTRTTAGLVSSLVSSATATVAHRTDPKAWAFDPETTDPRAGTPHDPHVASGATSARFRSWSTLYTS